jgi:hypothetical protein
MKDKSKHLWDYLTRKNPRLLQDPHFTSASVRRFFNHVYLAGFRWLHRRQRKLRHEYW